MLGESHHYGVTVSDLDDLLAFYVDILGMEEVNRVTHEGDAISKITGVEGTKMEILFLEAGGIGVELLQYHNPGGENANEGVRNCDVGSAHFCLEVEDVGRLHAELKEEVEFINPPQELSGGARVAYLYDPDGNVVELYQRG
ncbi:VOC family protein [Haladaptatus sp. CMAA 1911]|uniref:VOC family protein n=1 Tax=unclassified Haladaptatus TaxID=2622732 RepID=UPI003754A3A4